MTYKTTILSCQQTRFIQKPTEKLYHGTTYDRAVSILANGPKGNEFFVTPLPRIAENFAGMKRPWFGSMQQRTIAIIELTPTTDLITVAEPIISLTPMSGMVVAQYPDSSHHQHADLGWAPNYQYQFLTPRGWDKFTLSLPEENIKAPNCLSITFF